MSLSYPLVCVEEAGDTVCGGGGGGGLWGMWGCATVWVCFKDLVQMFAIFIQCHDIVCAVFTKYVIQYKQMCDMRRFQVD